MELLSLHLQDTTSFREGQVLPHLQDFFPFGLKRATLLEADTPSIHTSTMSKKKKKPLSSKVSCENREICGHLGLFHFSLRQIDTVS
jgi:hypothetical protein